jgi:chemotaxis regulatin CheY-phosphate phosphatase CheZ
MVTGWQKLQVEIDNCGRLMAAIGHTSGQYHRALSALETVRTEHAALLAAAWAVVEAWDRWMATNSPDRPSIQDLDAAIDALRPSSAPWYADS